MAGDSGRVLTISEGIPTRRVSVAGKRSGVAARPARPQRSWRKPTGRQAAPTASLHGWPDDNERSRRGDSTKTRAVVCGAPRTGCATALRYVGQRCLAGLWIQRAGSPSDPRILPSSRSSSFTPIVAPSRQVSSALQPHHRGATWGAVQVKGWECTALSGSMKTPIVPAHEAKFPGILIPERQLIEARHLVGQQAIPLVRSRMRRRTYRWSRNRGFPRPRRPTFSPSLRGMCPQY